MMAVIQDDPVAVVEAAIDAFQRQAWDEVPALCHPASLGAFKAQLLRHYEPPDGRASFSVDDMLRLIPDMPREVAEYNVAQRDRMIREMQDPSRELDGISSVDEVRSTRPAALFTAWLRAHAPAYAARRATQTDDERELARLIGEASGPRLVMCMRLPGGGWALRAEQHMFGLGSFGFGYGAIVSEEGQAEGDERQP